LQSCVAGGFLFFDNHYFKWYFHISMKKLVLLVEDDEVVGQAIKLLLEDDGWEVVWAKDRYEARDLYTAHKHEITAAVFDGYLEKTCGGNTFEIIRIMREDNFKGPMIAASSNPDMRKDMIRAGCTDQCPKDSISDCLIDQLNFHEL
jgi:CheY-like chemotaxis protein